MGPAVDSNSRRFSEAATPGDVVSVAMTCLSDSSARPHAIQLGSIAHSVSATCSGSELSASLGMVSLAADLTWGTQSFSRRAAKAKKKLLGAGPARVRNALSRSRPSQLFRSIHVKCLSGRFFPSETVARSARHPPDSATGKTRRASSNSSRIRRSQYARLESGKAEVARTSVDMSATIGFVELIDAAKLRTAARSPSSSWTVPRS